VTGRVAAAVVTALLAVATLATGAGAATPKTTVQAVEAEVMCVTCGVPLAIAESPQADAERRTIRRLVDQGLTKDQVKDRLVAIYGTKRVLAKPDDSGLGLAAYLVPIAVVLAVLGALAVIVPRWRRRRSGDDDDEDEGPGAPALSAADADRLEKDLARYGV
jgi:cytochrome c-type biogenesis protein CcmH